MTSPENRTSLYRQGDRQPRRRWRRVWRTKASQSSGHASNERNRFLVWQFPAPSQCIVRRSKVSLVRAMQWRGIHGPFFVRCKPSNLRSSCKVRVYRSSDLCRSLLWALRSVLRTLGRDPKWRFRFPTVWLLSGVTGVLKTLLFILLISLICSREKQVLKYFRFKWVATKSLLRIFIQKLLNAFVEFWIISNHHRPWEKNWVLDDQLVNHFWIQAGCKGVLFEVSFVHHDAKRPTKGGQLSTIM